MKTERVVWLGEHRKGDAAVRVGERGDELVVEWEGLGTLVASRDGARHAFTPASGLDPEGARKIERGVVRALVRHLQGRLTLHGSAVVVDGRAVVCVGPSGAGKSTLAAMLVGAGGELLADDMAAIEVPGDAGAPVVVAPSEDTFSLDDTSLEATGLRAPDVVNWEGKWLVPSAKIARSPAPLAAVLALRFDGEAPVVKPLRGLGVLAALVPCVPRFPTESVERHARELDQLEALARRGLVAELSRPRRIESARDTVEAVRAMITLGSGRNQPFPLP